MKNLANKNKNNGEETLDNKLNIYIHRYYKNEASNS